MFESKLPTPGHSRVFLKARDSDDISGGRDCLSCRTSLGNHAVFSNVT